MPRELPAIDTGNETVRKRKAVLRDTVTKLDTQDKRDVYHEKARQNHYNWSQNLQDAHESTLVSVIQGDWGDVTAARSKISGQIYAVLNMANAEIPGGSYLEGAAAQEENMFRRTDCHFYVADEDMNDAKNRYKEEMTQLINAESGKVYLDTDNPRVCIKGRETANVNGYEDLPEDEYFLFYELKSAADNLQGYNAQQLPFNQASMRRKIAAQLDTLIEKGIKHVVLSAFGCGAFGNPASSVAQIYKEELMERPGQFTDVVFAVYHAGYGVNNYPIFKNVLDGFDFGPYLSVNKNMDIEYLKEYLTLEIACIQKRNGMESAKAQKLQIVLDWINAGSLYFGERELSSTFGLVYSICCMKSAYFGIGAITSEASFKQLFNDKLPAAILTPNELLALKSTADVASMFDKLDDARPLNNSSCSQQ